MLLRNMFWTYTKTRIQSHTTIYEKCLIVSSINVTQSLSFETSAPSATDSQSILFISSETVCASSIFLAFVTMPEYLFDLANAITMAFPIPLLDPITTANFVCYLMCVYVCHLLNYE